MSRMIRVEVNDLQRCGWLPLERCHQVLEHVCSQFGLNDAEISVAVVGDGRSRDLHRRFLGDDSPTDVLTFPCSDGLDDLCGEIVLNADQACAMAPAAGWDAADELLLYFVHGALHLAGVNDTTESGRQEMFEHQRAVLALLGYPQDQLQRSVNTNLRVESCRT